MRSALRTGSSPSVPLSTQASLGNSRAGSAQRADLIAVDDVDHGRIDAAVVGAEAHVAGQPGERAARQRLQYLGPRARTALGRPAQEPHAVVRVRLGRV